MGTMAGWSSFFRVVELALVAAARDGRAPLTEALHVEQGEAAALHDLVGLTKLEQTIHDLALGEVATEIAVEHGGERRGAAAVVIGLAHQATELLLGQWLDL
jgi:hypothetical protein